MEYSFDQLPVSIDCHPTKRLIATGFIDGTLSISTYKLINTKAKTNRVSNGADSSTELRLTHLHEKAHKRAVRRLQFSPISGDRLLVITKNRALCQWDVESGRKLRCIKECHDAPPFAMHCLTDDQLATGDEIGVVKIWDWRAGRGRNACVMTFDQDVHADIINHMISGEDKRILLTASGDGTMSAFNLKKRALEMQSEEMHAELLSVAIAKNGEKVICGSGEGGFIEIFNWNEFGNINERMQTGHQDSVDRLLNLTDHGLVASASSDGCIRLLRIGQNNDLGIMGQHEENGKMSQVEDICCTYDQRYLLSCGQDQKLKFWDLDRVKKELGITVDSDEDGEPKKKKIKGKKKTPKLVDTSFFSGFVEGTGDNSGNFESDSDDTD